MIKSINPKITIEEDIILSINGSDVITYNDKDFIKNWHDYIDYLVNRELDEYMVYYDRNYTEMIALLSEKYDVRYLVETEGKAKFITKWSADGILIFIDKDTSITFNQWKKKYK